MYAASQTESTPAAGVTNYYQLNIDTLAPTTGIFVVLD